MPESSRSHSASKPLDLVGMIRRYGLFVAVLGGLLFCLLAPGAWLLSKNIYEAEGRLQISRVIPPLISQFERVSITNYFNDFAKTQVENILSSSVLEKALGSLPEELQDQFKPTDMPPDLALNLMRRSLTVGQVPGTHLISVKMQSRTPAGLAQAVNAIMSAYVDSSYEQGQFSDQAKLRYLQKTKAGLQKEVDLLTAELEELAAKTMTSTFSEEYNVENDRLEPLQKAFMEAYTERIRKENSYRELLKEVAKLRKLPIQSLADELVAKDESLWSIQYWTYKELQEMRASIDGTTRSNPDRKYIEERMQAMREYEANLKQEVSDRARRIVNDKRDYELEQRQLEAEHAFLAALQTEENIKLELIAAEKRLAANAQELIRGQTLVAKLEHLRQELYKFDSKISELKTEAQSNVRISVQSEARIPLSASSGNRKKLLMLCFALAFGSIGGLVLLSEVTDNRVRSVKDLENAVGGPVSWPISRYEESGGLARATLDTPAGQPAKALRSLAVKLNRERVEQGARLLVFTGTDREVGASSVLLNTAHVLSSLGGKVLIVDADSTHKGVGSALEAEADTPFEVEGCVLGNCFHHSKERGLDFLLTDASQWPRLESADFQQALDLLKDGYDCILIDTAPLLESDLSEFLAMQADVVVLVAQGDRTLFRNVAFITQLLVRMQVPAVATVLNWGARREPNLLERFIRKSFLFRKLIGSPRLS